MTDFRHENMTRQGKICPPEAECPDCPPHPRPLGVDPGAAEPDRDELGNLKDRLFQGLRELMDLPVPGMVEGVKGLIAEHKRHSSSGGQTAFAGPKKVQIVFALIEDGHRLEFVEVECEGKGIKIGEWKDREDGYTVLEFDHYELIEDSKYNERE